MKKTAAIILSALILTSILFTSCQKAKDTEGKKEAQVQQAQKEEVKQQSVETKPVEAKSEVLPKQEQLTAKADFKEEKKEMPKEAKPSPLTEKEQKAFSKWRNKWDGKTLTEEEAVKYLDILIKGNTYVRCYSEKEWWGTGMFEMDVNTLVDYLVENKNEEGYRLIIRILESPDDWLTSLSYMIKSVKSFEKKESIPVVKKFLSYKVPLERAKTEKTAKSFEHKYKLEAAGTLLYLGDADTALPVLDELANKEGSTGALYYLFSGPGKIIDERGYPIVEKALNRPAAEVRISAVGLLLESKKLTAEKAEEIALKILEELKDNTLKNYGLTYDPKGVAEIIPLPGSNANNVDKVINQRRSDARACEYTMNFLARLKSKKAVSILKHIEKNNTEWWYTCWNNHAKKALQAIEGEEK